MNSSLQSGAENAMSLRIGYLLPTRECIMAGHRRRRRCWNWLSELSASAYHFDVLLGERDPLFAAEQLEQDLDSLSRLHISEDRQVPGEGTT